jgi:hypothetical protein
LLSRFREGNAFSHNRLPLKQVTGPNGALNCITESGGMLLYVCLILESEKDTPFFDRPVGKSNREEVMGE